MQENQVFRLFKQASIQFLDDLLEFDINPVHVGALRLIRTLIDSVQARQVYEAFVSVLEVHREALVSKDDQFFSDPQNDLLQQLGRGLVPPVLSGIWAGLDVSRKTVVFEWLETLMSIVDENK